MERFDVGLGLTVGFLTSTHATITFVSQPDAGEFLVSLQSNSGYS
jgi:hypothetical protein